MGSWVEPRERSDEELQEFRARVARIKRVGVENMPLSDALEVLGDSSLEPAVRRSVLQRRDLPFEAFRAVLTDPEDTVRAFAVGSMALPVALVATAESDPAWQVRAELARREDCPSTVLSTLAIDDSAVVRRAALAHDAIDDGVLVRVLVYGHSRLDAELAAAHPRLNPHDHKTELLSANNYGAVALLARSDLSAVLVRRFAELDRSDAVRAKAVNHPKCPTDVVAICATADPESIVRAAAAGRSRCPSDALHIAAQDPSSVVRRAVGENPRCPAEAVNLLLTDVDEAVRTVAARSESADPTMLAALVDGDPVESVRKAAVANRCCPSDCVDRACGDPVLLALAIENPSCTAEGAFHALLVIRDLPRHRTPADSDAESSQHDRTRNIAVSALRRVAPKAWSWLQPRALETLHEGDLSAVLTRHLTRAAVDPRRELRVCVAKHPKVSAETLAQLAADEDEEIRLIVTQRILGAAGGLRS